MLFIRVRQDGAGRVGVPAGLEWLLADMIRRETDEEVAKALSAQLQNPQRYLDLEKEIKQHMTGSSARKRREMAQRKKVAEPVVIRVPTAVRTELATNLQKLFRGRRTRAEHGQVKYDRYDNECEVVRTTSSMPKRKTEEGDPSPVRERVPSEPSVYRSLNTQEVDQVGGHGMLRRASSEEGVLVKQGPACEMRVYREMQSSDLRPLLPAFHGGQDYGALCDLRLEVGPHPDPNPNPDPETNPSPMRSSQP